MATQRLTQQAVLAFWFEELKPSDWFAKSDKLDDDIRARFGALHQQAMAGDLDHWIEEDDGALALVIVLDQFSRNIHRNTPGAFAGDDKALQIAAAMVQSGRDKNLNAAQRLFLYMPYMHSESLAVHQQAEKLFTSLGRPENLEFERRHKAIIERFGRYPHRNAILGRESTPEEEAFLQTPGSSF